MNRRNFIKTLTAGTALALAPNACSPKKTRQPNILLFTADDLNYDSVGAFGGRVPGATPNMDRLASEGVRFTNAHISISVCQPNRSVLMTGRYPHRNGSMGFEPIREDVPTLQEKLREAGYLNGICGKPNHLTPQEKFCWDTVIPSSELWMGRSPQRFYEQTLKFFNESKESDRPFFLMVNSEDPHRPFPGSKQEDSRKNWLKDLEAYPPADKYYNPDEVEVPGFLPDLPDIRKEVAQYFTAVRRCDETLGQVLRSLEESGLAENTLVMFLSDNGMAFPYSKTNCYLNSTKTPWIVRWPGKTKAGSVESEHMISSLDFMPTILDAATLPQTEGMDGRSFLPLLKGKRQQGKDKVFTSFFQTSAKKDFPMRSVQTKNFGYIYNAWADGETVFKNESQSGLTFKAMTLAAETNPEIAARVKFFQYRIPEELYDNQKDPNSLNNLIDKPEFKAEVEKMRRELLANLESTKDPLAETFRLFLENQTRN